MDGKESYTEEALAQQVTSTDKNKMKPNKDPGQKTCWIQQRGREEERGFKAIRRSKGSKH